MQYEKWSEQRPIWWNRLIATLGGAKDITIIANE